MKPRIKQSIEALVPDILISRLRGALKEDRLTVLAFHGVESAEHFADQIDLLSGSCRFVDASTVLASLENGDRLPRGATLVTFDDAERSVLENALDVLVSRGISSVLFPVAGLVGTERSYWWREAEWLIARGVSPVGAPAGSAAAVRHLKTIPDAMRRAALEEMRRRSPEAPPQYPQLSESELRRWMAAGQEIGNHTYSHPCLPRCGEAEIREEIVLAHQRLTEIMGREPRLFAYPNGDVAEAAVATLRELGYRLGFLFDHRLATWPPKDPLRVSRLRVNSTDSLKRVGLCVSGVHPAVYQARMRVARVGR